jgi:predicted nucleic acid-binding Zn ribbon protein
MLQKENTYELKDLLQRLIKAYRWGGKMDEMKVRDSWRLVVGRMIERHTESVNLRNKILYVKLDSAALRNELMMARSKIANSINKEMGRKVVDDIVFR